MTPAGAYELAVSADLDLSVTAPDGRTGRVVVRDRDGTLDVRLSGTRALLASLPRGGSAAGTGPARAVLDAARGEGVGWSQPVDVRVGDRLVLRRRSSRWRPAPAVGVPAVAASLVLVLGALLGVLLAVRMTYRLLRHLLGRHG